MIWTDIALMVTGGVVTVAAGFTLYKLKQKDKRDKDVAEKIDKCLTTDDIPTLPFVSDTQLLEKCNGCKDKAEDDMKELANELKEQVREGFSSIQGALNQMSQDIRETERKRGEGTEKLHEKIEAVRTEVINDVKKVGSQLMTHIQAGDRQ